jgi:hypothetical protein
MPPWIACDRWIYDTKTIGCGALAGIVADWQGWRFFQLAIFIRSPEDVQKTQPVDGI